jgi:hypothetical protein
MGASRRAHHAAVAAERQAGIEATRMRIEQENAERRMREMAEALKPVPSTYQAPEAKYTAQTLGTTGAGVRTARSARTTARGLGKGLAALRIPLNIGGITGGGLNIG